MPKLRIPSPQHLARNWYADPAQVKKELLRLARNPPRKSYSPLFLAAADLMRKHDYSAVVNGIARSKDSKMLLPLLPLIFEYAKLHQIVGVYQFEPHSYKIDSHLMVPFKPPITFRAGGKNILPWFSFWADQPVVGERLSLQVTILDEIERDSPHFEGVETHIVDFSAKRKSGPRVLSITEVKDIPRLSKTRMNEMLDIYVQGFRAAQTELEGEHKQSTQQTAPTDSRQMDMFQK
jgi:hypothetical protein